ncbi:MAG: penicillin acylase family protein [Minicystis sp.]
MSTRGTGRWLKRIGLGLLALLALLGLGLYGFLRGSMATLDGEVAVSGLGGTVTVTRDALGIPTLQGSNRLDLVYATGYLHAQDRFFQMDLLRRVAAGELAELFGPAALEIDRDHRLHRFRARGETALKAMPAADRQLLDRYVSGVNDGLAALSARPFEYGLLNLRPRPWAPADTLLVAWAMYFDLQGDLESRELARGWLREHSSAEQLAFLLPELDGVTAYDAPLDGAPITAGAAPIPARAPDWFGRAGKVAALALHTSVGSSNWALAGSRTEHGGAIVANDMHLGIHLPHIWYRVVLNYPGADGKPRRVAGVTLPGEPLVVVGSNGHVAWGFTNSFGDCLDMVELERDPGHSLRFKVGADWETATEVTEQLAVKGAATEALKVVETSLGPVREVGGRFYAVHWVAHEAGAVNFNLGRLENADDLVAAQAAGNSAGIPAENMIAGDAAGHVGWTIAGPLPDRAATPAASFPLAAGEAAALGWRRLRAAADYPRVLNPEFGQIWTANNRQLSGAEYAKLGDGGTDLGVRARQIRDDLAALGKSDEHGVYSIGLDDRALFIGEWRERALKALVDADVAGRPERAEFRRLLEQSWTGRADAASVGYTLARAYLHALYAELFGGLDAEELGKYFKGSGFYSASSRWPVVIGRLLDARPAGWLPNERSWHAVELAAVDRAIAEVTKNGEPLAKQSWGLRNTARISHPFVHSIPFLKRWLSAPADPLPGDENMPRVAAPSFGQSERMAVSPGKEELGIFNMPGGQSGHPLSPYFLAGHAAWVKGEATPFLPGPAEHTLRFVPR